jgi:hypothetical protein
MGSDKHPRRVCEIVDDPCAHDGGVAIARQRGGGALLDRVSNRAAANQLWSLLRELRQRQLRVPKQRGAQQDRARDCSLDRPHLTLPTWPIRATGLRPLRYAYRHAQRLSLVADVAPIAHRTRRRAPPRRFSDRSLSRDTPTRGWLPCECVSGAGSCYKRINIRHHQLLWVTTKDYEDHVAPCRADGTTMPIEPRLPSDERPQWCGLVRSARWRGRLSRVRASSDIGAGARRSHRRRRWRSPQRSRPSPLRRHRSRAPPSAGRRLA